MIEIKGLYKSYGSKNVLSGINRHWKTRRFTASWGETGSARVPFSV